MNAISQNIVIIRIEYLKSTNHTTIINFLFTLLDLRNELHTLRNILSREKDVVFILVQDSVSIIHSAVV